MAVLEVRDRGHRHRARKFAEQVTWFLNGMGLPVTSREDSAATRIKLSEAVLDEDWKPQADDGGTIVGLQHWSITTKADFSHDWSGNLNLAERRKGSKDWAAVVGYRRSPALAGEQWVMISLETFAQVLRVTEGLDE